MKQVLFLLLILLAGITGHAQNTGTLAGTITDKETQQPVIGATISLVGTSLGTVTDTAGYFKLENIPTQTYNIRIQSLGYEPNILYNVVITSGNEKVINATLQSGNSTKLNEVVVKSNPFQHTAETPLSIQSLSAQEIQSNPGGNFDVSRVIQAFPGVGGTSGVGGYRNDLIIRGGAPNENVYYLDGIEVPVINHFATQGSAGGPTGIINLSFLQDVDLYTSAFPAKYDNVLSGVLQMKLRDPNTDKIEHNVRLSATELAYTVDGPINNKWSFMASGRRSYLQLLFKALQLPLQPSYWDFQYKVNCKINKKLTFYTLGIGAIDKFSFQIPNDLTPENIYILQSNPFIRQWSYTNGYGLKKLESHGYWNLTFSRSMLINQLDKYEDNQHPTDAKHTLKLRSTEAQNILRFEHYKFLDKWNYSWGVMAQLDEFKNDLFSVVRSAVTDSNGNVMEPAISINNHAVINFIRYGAYAQVARNLLNRRLTLSLGLRTDGNTFTTNGNNLGQQLSPRLAASVKLTSNLKFNASIGRYFKIPVYTVLGYKDSLGNLVNKDAKYTQCDHLVGGFEYLPAWEGSRFTLEGFYKKYSNYPVSLVDGISLANKGGDFNVLGNEPVNYNGNGRSYGIEFQFQQKLTKNFFAILSYTLYKSEFTNADGKYVPASWDDGQLISFIGGYKFRHNIELGIKFRYQGGAPYTPFDMQASQANYLTLGKGIPDYSQFNTLRLKAFNAMDVRIDKKWNYKKWSLDLYLDLTNVYASVQPSVPDYTFKRTPDNKAFATTDGKPIKADGSNAIPIVLDNQSATVIPSIGFIVAF